MTDTVDLTAQPTTTFDTYLTGNIMEPEALSGYVYYYLNNRMWRWGREAYVGQILAYYHDGTEYGVPVRSEDFEYNSVFVYYNGDIYEVESTLAYEAMNCLFIDSLFSYYDTADVELLCQIYSVFSTYNGADTELLSTISTTYFTTYEDSALTSSIESAYETFNGADVELTCSVSTTYSCVVA